MTYGHAEHEARHVVASWFVGREVKSAAVGVHALEEGIVETAPMENGVANLITRLVGWCGDPDLPENAWWPPPYPPPTEHDPDGVGWCVRHFGLSRHTYEAVVRIALDLLDDPDFQEAIALVARGLMTAPLLDAESLETLRGATAFAEPEPEGVLTTWST